MYRPARKQRVLTRSYGTVLTMTTPIAHSDFFSVPGLILGLFDRPHWLSPPWNIQFNHLINQLKIQIIKFRTHDRLYVFSSRRLRWEWSLSLGHQLLSFSICGSLYTWWSHPTVISSVLYASIRADLSRLFLTIYIELPYLDSCTKKHKINMFNILSFGV